MVKYSSFVALLFLAFIFVQPSWSIQKMGSIAIFTEAVSWTDVGTANAEAQEIINNLKITRDIQIMGDKEIGEFAKKNTNDNDLDIIITFGYFPVSLYKPGNAEANGSVGEKFLEGGDMFLNTADYIFYVTQGGGTNGDQGLKNMTDSNFDMWTDNTRCSPTDDGKKYAPSIPAQYDAPRCFKTDQVGASKDWEVELALGSNGATYIDPAIIHNKDYDGRVAIVFQAGGTLPRGEVIVEILDKWLSSKIKAQPVDPLDKLPITWGKIKRSL